MDMNDMMKLMMMQKMMDDNADLSMEDMQKMMGIKPQTEEPVDEAEKDPVAELADKFNDFLENVYGDFTKNVNKRLEDLTKRIEVLESLDGKVTKLDGRITKLDGRLDSKERQIDKNTTNYNNLNTKFNDIDDTLNKLKKDVTNITSVKDRNYDFGRDGLENVHIDASESGSYDRKGFSDEIKRQEEEYEAHKRIDDQRNVQQNVDLGTSVDVDREAKSNDLTYEEKHELEESAQKYDNPQTTDAIVDDIVEENIEEKKDKQEEIADKKEDAVEEKAAEEKVEETHEKDPHQVTDAKEFTNDTSYKTKPAGIFSQFDETNEEKESDDKKEHDVFDGLGL